MKLPKSLLTSYEESREGGDYRKVPVVCPQPRRLGGPEPVRPVALHACLSKHHRPSDSEASQELFDIFFGKFEESYQIASSPPFFCGSPPRRASNPLIQDPRFGEEILLSSFVPVAMPLSSTGTSTGNGIPKAPASSALAHKGPKGCEPTKFGFQPARRIEGFDCLNRDRRGCGITAKA